jgi:CHAD domain-containing protein
MERSTLSVALLRQRLVSLLKAMPAAQAGDESSVHEARVASRRLRGVLPVIGASADANTLDRAQRQVRRITRALGPVRELDVSLRLLAEFEKKGPAPARAIARVRDAIMAQRVARRREMLDAITPTRLDKLRKRLVRVAVPEVHREPRPNEVNEALRQAGDRAAILRAAIEHAGQLYLADRLHRVRVATKKLRYALEILRELTHSRASARINKVKAQQDLLGRIQDLEVLIDRTRVVQENLAASNRRGTIELDGLIRALEDECRECHAAYMRSQPAMIKLCDSVIEAAVTGRPSAVA